MTALLPFLALDQNCEQVHAWVSEELTRAGFRVARTFDLHVARLAHPDCPCPHHGTDQCNCQMLVLLVYGKQEDPATLVIHGQDGQTWLSLATPVETRSRQHLESSVRNVLIPRHADTSIPIEVPYEIGSKS